MIAERSRVHLAELLHCAILSERNRHDAITQSGSDSNDSMFEPSRNDERRVLEAWTRSPSVGGEATREHGTLVAALLRGFARSPREVVQMAAAAAAFGAAEAARGNTLAELVVDLDSLESALFSAFVRPGGANDATPTGPRASAQEVHELCSVARTAAIAGYGQTMTERARARVRSARHDIVNAIGAVRNSMLMMDDEPAGNGRERLRAIARRNSRRSEALVRSFLADDSVLTAAIGWAEVDGRRSRDASSSEPTERATTDVAAALALASVIERAGAAPTSSAATMEFVPAADSPLWRADVLAAFRELATTLGVQFETDARSGSFRFRLPLIARHSRDDLGSSGESQDRDAVGF